MLKINAINRGRQPMPTYATSQSAGMDLRANLEEPVVLHPMERRLIPTGLHIALPEGYEAHIAPRSSAFKRWGIIQANSVGVIDNSYCGDNDIWMMPVYATRFTEIKKNDRICQFRIVEKQPHLEFETVDHLDNKDRGGFGSTGRM